MPTEPTFEIAVDDAATDLVTPATGGVLNSAFSNRLSQYVSGSTSPASVWYSSYTPMSEAEFTNQSYSIGLNQVPTQETPPRETLPVDESQKKIYQAINEYTEKYSKFIEQVTRDMPPRYSNVDEIREFLTTQIFFSPSLFIDKFTDTKRHPRYILSAYFKSKEAMVQFRKYAPRELKFVVQQAGFGYITARPYVGIEFMFDHVGSPDEVSEKLKFPFTYTEGYFDYLTGNYKISDDLIKRKVKFVKDLKSKEAYEIEDAIYKALSLLNDSFTLSTDSFGGVLQALIQKRVEAALIEERSPRARTGQVRPTPLSRFEIPTPPSFDELVEPTVNPEEDDYF